MKKLCIVCLAVVLVFLWVASSGTELKIGGGVGYYSPNFGAINKLLAEEYFPFGRVLKGGLIYGINF